MDYKGKILRVIDANINRAKEGSRVCEDIMRLVINDKDNTIKLKKTRHNITKIARGSKIKQFDIVQNRDSRLDVGKKVSLKNSKRIILDIFTANSQRVKEALRVLEELFNVFDVSASRKFQDLRFKFYNVEKDCFEKLAHSRYKNLP